MDPILKLDITEVRSHLTTYKFLVSTAQSYQSVETSTRGLHTYGHIGLALKNKIINIWRKMFITSDIFEIDTPILISKEVLTNSGHVSKFNDLVVTNGSEIFRADHLVKDFCDKNNITLSRPIDDFTKEELLELVKYHKMIDKSEEATITPKNLMFNFGDMYLRPEIAQGIFTEFNNYHQSYKLPFGLAQVGKSYRNEISPQPFTRLREFTQAEVEYFFDPHEETHCMYDLIKDLVIPLFSEYDQLNNNPVKYIKISDAMDDGTIVNQIMAYYLATIYKFAKILGLTDDVIRFRQHLSNELAHYARQCWDLEVLLANDQWLECIGCAHRGDHDLTVHNIKGQNFIQNMQKNAKSLKYL